MLRAPVILLVLRVCDCLSQSSCEGVGVRALDADAAVILLEVVNLANFLELLLECIFDMSGQASIVLIDLLVKLGQVLLVTRLKQLAELVKDHGHVEANQACLETDLTA